MPMQFHSENKLFRNPIGSSLTPTLAQADVEYFKLVTKSPIIYCGMTNFLTRNELLIRQTVATPTCSGECVPIKSVT